MLSESNKPTESSVSWAKRAAAAVNPPAVNSRSNPNVNHRASVSGQSNVPASNASSCNNWPIGLRVRLRLSNLEELSGEVFAFEASSGTLVLLDNAPASTKGSMRIIKVSYVKDIIEAIPRFGATSEVLPTLNLEKLKAREAKTLRRAREDAAKINLDVPPNVQSLFNALSRT